MPEKITIQEALEILGSPVRAKRAGQWLQPDPENTNKRKGQLYWLDGRLVTDEEVKRAALEHRRQKSATN